MIYSGEYAKKAEATKALGSLKRSFPGAVVIQVSSGGSGLPERHWQRRRSSPARFLEAAAER